jgi:hypothetical protein
MGSTAPALKEFPITWEKGLVLEVEDSTLEIGQASELENYEPTAQGGLRARNGWADISTLGLPTNYQVRGWGAIAAPQPPAIVQEAAANGVESGAEGYADSKTVELNNVSIGNILAAVVTARDTTAIVPSAGWTQRLVAVDSYRLAMFTKVATSAAESFTASAGAIASLRPIATTTETWPVSAADLWANLADESDSTGSGATATATGYGLLTAAADPGINSGHVLKIRSYHAPGTGAGSAQLYQGDPGAGGTLIVDTGALPELSSIIETIVELTEAQAANITDYSNLYWRIVASGGTHVSQFFRYELLVPSGSAVHHVHMFEMSGLAGEAPTATDFGQAVTSDTLSAAGTPPGLALLAGMQKVSGAWQNAPGGAGWITQADTTDAAARSTVATKSWSTSPVTDTIDANGANNLIAGLAIWNAAPSSSRPSGYFIVIAVATDTGYSLYKIPREEIETGTWELMDSKTSADTSGLVSMDVSAGKLIWSAGAMTTVRSVVIDTLVGSDIASLNSKAGRVVVAHKDRVFVGGAIGTPSRVYFSAIGDPTSYTTATDYLDIGGDDGEAVELGLSVEGLLLLGKSNRLYLVSGSGIETFFVNELPGGSAATGRPGVRTPYGTIVVGPDDIWVVQGGSVDPMSRPLGEAFEVTGLATAAYGQDSVLIADSGSGLVYRANLVTGAWAKERVTSGENQVHSLFSLQGRLYYGVGNSATAAGGTRRLSSARGYDETTGIISYLASTGRMSLLGPSARYTPRFLSLQLRSQDPSKPNTIFVTIETDIGEPYTDAVAVDSLCQVVRFDLGRFGGAGWIKLSYAVVAGPNAAAIDVEKTVLGVMIEPYR